jgi:hypothetical protein
MKRKFSSGFYWSVQYPTITGETRTVGNAKTFTEMLLTIVEDSVKYPTGGKIIRMNIKK